jgi:TfoX/Sxy family transcriptional regulator of competence genes
MPYNAHLEERILAVIGNWENTTQKKMFGGVCHLLSGNMFCGVYRDFLILRLGEARSEQALKQPHVRPMDITGRPMKGWVMVAAEGFAVDGGLANWLAQAREFAGALPPK